VKGLKYAIIPVLLLATVGSGSYYIYNNNLVKSWEDKIYPETLIHNIDVSGKTKEEAITMLQDNNKFIKDKKINLRYKDKVYTLKYSVLKPKYNIGETVAEVLKAGKNLGMLEKAGLIKNPSQKKYDLKFIYDKKAVAGLLNKIEKEVNKKPEDASVTMSAPGRFSIKKEITGQKLKKEEMEKVILSSINDKKEEVIEIPLAIQETVPKITYEKLSKINTVVSSFTTSFTSSAAGRATNIELAAKKINCTLIMPGDVFSFNSKTGPRDQAHGYQTAPIILKNKLEAGLGGGVCQVSTTLYNAIIRTNIKATERSNHSLVPAYVKPGFDATVSEYIDYKFKNTLSFPIFIEGVVKNRRLTFNVYSNSSLKKIQYDLVNEVYENTPATTQKIEDPTLPIGTIKEEEPPHNGCKVKVYLVGKQKGKEVSRRIISNNTYKKVDGIIKVGTKNVEIEDIIVE
jgi:vancomycin resistance protein YoaR